MLAGLLPEVVGKPRKQLTPQELEERKKKVGDDDDGDDGGGGGGVGGGGDDNGRETPQTAHSAGTGGTQEEGG